MPNPIVGAFASNLGAVQRTMNKFRSQIPAFGLLAGILAAQSVAQAHKGPDFVSVNTSADSGRGSLRDAINLANDDAETQIVFRIPTTDPAYNPKTGVFTLYLKSPLPPVTGADTVFDGLAQTLAYDSNKKGPEIKISGKYLRAGTPGFVIRGSRCEIKGLTIADFPGHAIVINGDEALETLVQSNVIENNKGCGVVISDGASASRIGIAAERGKEIDEEFKGVYGEPKNRFVRNGQDGVRIVGNESLGNSVRGNDFAANGWLPIRLRTGNDAGLRPARLEGNEHPNGGQLPPRDLSWDAGKRMLSGALIGKPKAEYLVDVWYFDNPKVKEDWRYAGHIVLKTDAQGKARWSLKAKSPKSAHVKWGATATAPDGSTSEMQVSSVQN